MTAFLIIVALLVVVAAGGYGLGWGHGSRSQYRLDQEFQDAQRDECTRLVDLLRDHGLSERVPAPATPETTAFFEEYDGPVWSNEGSEGIRALREIQAAEPWRFDHLDVHDGFPVTGWFR